MKTLADACSMLVIFRVALLPKQSLEIQWMQRSNAMVQQTRTTTTPFVWGGWKETEKQGSFEAVREDAIVKQDSRWCNVRSGAEQYLVQ